MKKYKVVFYGVPDSGYLEYTFTAKDADDLLEKIREFIRQKPDLDFDEYQYYPVIDNK